MIQGCPRSHNGSPWYVWCGKCNEFPWP
uniref:Uncharacterized protein n=1 Tax=Anguilla anguilla TaxID=7936 RepID=A0A0E9U6H8_ANGAN